VRLERESSGAKCTDQTLVLSKNGQSLILQSHRSFVYSQSVVVPDSNSRSQDDWRDNFSNSRGSWPSIGLGRVLGSRGNPSR
jgi:hypothetical protein